MEIRCCLCKPALLSSAFVRAQNPFRSRHMARPGNNKGGGGNSRIRFIMLEAEMSDGDLSQITEAISNALRPNTVVQQRLIAAPAISPIGANSDIETIDAVVVEEDASEGEVASFSSNKTSSRPRRYRSPVVLELDLTSPLSFSEFAAQKRPSNDHKRFLVVAAWFKLYRGVEAITMDHAYTCYRAVKWPTSIPDFDGPLRALKKRQLVNKTGKGEYAINHLGMAEVEDLGKGDGDS
jgi:hypothetical protein